MTDSHVEAAERRHPSEVGILDDKTLDPSLHYRFVQERPTQVSRARLKGYKIVRPSEDGVKTRFDQEDKPAEDIIKHGDRILMAVPKAKHRQHREQRKTRALRRLESSDKKARSLAKERGVRIHEDDDKED